jgi:hypothetical protein
MLTPGTTLGGRYRLDDRIAGGGMGDVWRATDEVLGRTVAVKVLLAALLEEPGFAERFRGEARTMATINHPGVVDIYDYGNENGTAFLVMEYIEGDALSRTLSRVGRLTPGRTMALIAQAADALHAAHEKGIVHRDVKPGNLLVRPNGTLVLTDFGIARSAMVGQLTAAGSVLGTASYISPEQASGLGATPLSDVYALGIVAYQCLSGRRPFEGENPLEIAMRHVRDTPPPLPPDIPPPVRQIVETAMAKDPAQRYPSAAALGHIARRAASQLAAGTTAAGPTGAPVGPTSGGPSGPPAPGGPQVSGPAGYPVSGVPAGYPVSGGPVSGGPVSGGPVSGGPSFGKPAEQATSGAPAAAYQAGPSSGGPTGFQPGPSSGGPAGFPPGLNPPTSAGYGEAAAGGTRIMPGGPPGPAGPVGGQPAGPGQFARGAAGVPPAPGRPSDTGYTYVGTGPIQPADGQPRPTPPGGAMSGPNARRNGLIAAGVAAGLVALLVLGIGGFLLLNSLGSDKPNTGNGTGPKTSASPSPVGSPVKIDCKGMPGNTASSVKKFLESQGFKVNEVQVDDARPAGDVVEVPCEAPQGSTIDLKVSTGKGSGNGNGQPSANPTCTGFFGCVPTQSRR